MVTGTVALRFETPRGIRFAVVAAEMPPRRPPGRRDVDTACFTFLSATTAPDDRLLSR